MSNAITPVALAAWAALTLVTRQAPPSEDEIRSIAAEGYVFGYPLVLMDVTRQKTTTAPTTTSTATPVNKFSQLRTLADARGSDVPAPDADTLSSSAWLDLSREPVVLSLPDTAGRYYLMPMLDGWSNVFASPGKRTTGTRKIDIAICGPRWQGTLPKKVEELRAPTEMVWILGRTRTDGVKDYDAVHVLQDRYMLTPLSAWGRPYTPPKEARVEPTADRKTRPVEQIARMSGVAFFARLAAAMKGNPPAQDDAAIVAKLARIGCVPGTPFEPDASSAAAIDAAVARASEALLVGINEAAGVPTRGWKVDTGLGTYGTDYHRRAVVAATRLGAYLDADAMAPTARADADGRALDGGQRYVLHFEKEETPPVSGFWSVSAYDDRQAFVANPLDRYTIGDRDALKTNADGSLDIYIQNASPGADKESNWLPAPKERFSLILRMYWPEDEVLRGAYAIPEVTRVR